MNDRRSSCETNDKANVSREDVRDFYSSAAVSAQESLCCPTQYDSGDLSHIPKEVLEISYGCGSPVNRANIHKGETVVDLGSGGGIDCFIAAKYVGESGRVYGIDMTHEMLNVARKNAIPVAKNLGYSNVEFKQGFLESLPLEDQSVDLVTSNCVINLSLNKKDVFKEIHRVLKPSGRFVIADIISEREVPEEMRNQQDLWGECISGALTLNEFMDSVQKNQFHGLTVKKDYLWKEVEGIKFYSYTLEGYKHASHESTSCGKTFTAVYSGPFNTITCEGTEYEVGIPTEIDEQTAAILKSHPYAGHFIVTDLESESPLESDSCCG